MEMSKWSETGISFASASRKQASMQTEEKKS